MNILAEYTPSAELWALLTLIFGGVGRFCYDMSKRKQDRLDREQDRLDRAQLATLTLDQLEAVKASGSERLKVLVKEVQDVKKVAITGIRASKEAIETANGVNAKIAALGQKLVNEKSSHDPSL